MINRTAVRPDPAKDFKAADDFFNLVWEAYVVVAAKSLIDSETTSTSSVDDLTGKMHMAEVFLLLPNLSLTPFCDSVYNYALDVLNLGLVYEGFHNSVREGDGDRLLLHQSESLPKRLAEQVRWSRFINNRESWM